jgi:hypothetical protein
LGGYECASASAERVKDDVVFDGVGEHCALALFKELLAVQLALLNSRC